MGGCYITRQVKAHIREMCETMQLKVELVRRGEVTRQPDVVSYEGLKYEA